MMSKKLG